MTAGLPIPAIDRIRIFSPSQWEDFVWEWADSLKDIYDQVERCGGAGDMGRDVIAFDKNDPAVWDNYQCKHYKTGLTPSNIWVELGKLVYYTHCNEYSYPRRYSFVAPQGAGTKLSNLLKNPAELKKQFLENWDDHCKTGITSTKVIELDSTLLAHIHSLDFSIFEATPPLRLIDQHAKTRWHAARFGGGLKARPDSPNPPVDVANEEVNYVRELLGAYSDHLKCTISTPVELTPHNDIHEHFSDSRVQFYSAEALRGFSRDTLPPNAYEQLQAEFHNGIKDELRGEHTDAYRRVMAVVKTARLLPITNHALQGCLSQLDRGGICHQLVNDKKVRWIK